MQKFTKHRANHPNSRIHHTYTPHVKNLCASIPLTWYPYFNQYLHQHQITINTMIRQALFEFLHRKYRKFDLPFRSDCKHCECYQAYRTGSGKCLKQPQIDGYRSRDTLFQHCPLNQVIK